MYLFSQNQLINTHLKTPFLRQIFVWPNCWKASLICYLLFFARIMMVHELCSPKVQLMYTCFASFQLWRLCRWLRLNLYFLRLRDRACWFVSLNSCVWLSNVLFHSFGNSSTKLGEFLCASFITSGYTDMLKFRIWFLCIASVYHIDGLLS